MTSVDDVRNVIYGLSCRCHPEKGIRYVGQTSRYMRDRWNDHTRNVRRGLSSAITAWGRKHGVGNIQYEILEAVESEDLLDDREIFWIARLDTHKHGLNRTAGGRWSAASLNQRGSLNAYSRLTEDDIPEICELLLAGVSQAQIANRFGVSRNCIAAISRGGTWAHLTAGIGATSVMRQPRTGPRVGELTGNCKLIASQVDYIRRSYDPTSGTTTYTIAEELGVSANTVQHVINGVTWSHHETPGYIRRNFGTLRPRARLTKSDVVDIKRVLAAGGRGIGQQLAIRYNVSAMTISDIKRGATWGDVQVDLTQAA